MAGKKREDYIDALDGAAASGSGQYAAGSREEQAAQYAEMSRNQEYTKLLDAEIELENAKESALKYTNNQTAAMGLDTQGYGSTGNAGIHSRYMNAINEANRQYSENVKDIDQAERDEMTQIADDRFQSVTTMLSQATSSSALNQLMADYGYGTLDEEGNFAWGERPEGMSSDDWNQIRYYYALQKEAIDQNETLNQYGDRALYGSLDSLNAGTYVNRSGQVATLQSNFEQEMLLIWHRAATQGSYPQNSVIKVTNGDGETVYLEWLGSQYGFRQVGNSEFNAAEHAYEITRDPKKKVNVETTVR